jgi:biopolymer transport protein ExbD
VKSPETPRLSRLDPSDGASLNLTPLIDVVLLLLLFFMLTSPMVLRTALPALTPPTTTHPRAAIESRRLIGLDADDRLSLDGQALSAQDLDRRLPELRPRVMVMADDRASLGATVRLLDACRTHDVAVDIYAAPSETHDPRPKTHDPRPKTHDPRPKTHDPSPKTHGKSKVQSPK